MFLEYDWTLNVYRPRIGFTFTDIRGVRSYETLEEAREHLRSAGLQLTQKTDTRTWRIEVGPTKDGVTLR